MTAASTVASYFRVSSAQAGHTFAFPSSRCISRALPPIAAATGAPPTASAARTHAANVGRTRGWVVAGCLRASYDHRWIRTSPGMLPRLSLAADEHQPAGTEPRRRLLCSEIATRGFALELKLFQGPKCEDGDSGE
jgi:hypothetical protein